MEKYKHDICVNQNVARFDPDTSEWMHTRYEDYYIFEHYYNGRKFSRHFNPLFF